MPEDFDDLFGRWIRDYTPQLMVLARSFADGHEEAVDLVQEVWVVALRHVQEHRPGVSTRAWLYSIALNVCRAAYRKRQRRQNLMRFWSRDIPQPTSTVTDPSISRHLVARALWQAVGRLPKLQREVFLLRVVDELRFGEVARVLDRKEGTVKSSYHRAKTKLEAELAAHSPQDLMAVIGGQR